MQPLAVRPSPYGSGVARKVDPEDLVGVAEIAERLGCSVQAVHAWKRRHKDFPSPVAHLTMGLLWVWPEVRHWAHATGRLGT
jgi:hypothetical protein